MFAKQVVVCMSESRQSRAAVIRVKGVSFNYLQFLWSGIGEIRKQQAQGNFAGAMAIAAAFIAYLPDSMKDEFRKRAADIRAVMDRIQAGNVPEIKAIADFFLRGIYRNRVLQIFSSEALTQFTDDMTSRLNSLGYMENIKQEAIGEADENVDWVKMDQRRKAAQKGGRRRKRDSSPVGNMD